MAFVTLQSQTIPDWQYGGTTATLYIWSSQAFFEQVTGEYVAQGQVNNAQSPCQIIDCTVSGTTLTIPAVTLATTTDSSVPTALYTAIIANEQGGMVYPLLQNFFVDPEYYQTPAFASMLVEDAGTDVANGYYTYRGTFASLPYYNLLGQATSTSLYAIVGDGNAWNITASDGAILYNSNTYPSFPSDTTFAVSAGDSPAPTVSQSFDYVYATWEQLILSNQGIGVIPVPQWVGPFWNVQQTKEYVNSLVGDGTTPFASVSVAGKTKLDTAPDLASDPIAVGTNSPRVVKVLSLDYANSFATAITDIGSDDVTLYVKAPVTVSSNTTLPANITLVVSDEGLITIAANRTLTINSMVNTPSKQIFALAAGTSHVLFTERAVPSINIAWFASTADVTQALNEALASCSANDGGSIYVPENTWTTTAEHLVVPNLIIFGDGRESVIQTQNGGTGIFVHEPGIYNVNIRDLTLDGDGTLIGGYVCQGEDGQDSAGQLQFNNVLFTNCEYGFRIVDTLANAWQMATVHFDSQCVFRDNTTGMSCNTTNNVVLCEAFFEMSAGQVGVDLLYAGQWTFLNNEFAGTTSSKAYQIESQTIVAAAGVTGAGIAESVVTASGMVGSPKTVSVTVDTSMTTATLIANAFRAALGADPSVTSFFHIGGTGAEVQLIALNPAANDGTMNFTINTGTATGITNSATSTNTVAGASDTTQPIAVQIANEHGTLNFIGVVEERCKSFLVNEWSSLNGIINFIGCSIQDPVLLNDTCSVNTTDCQIVDRTFRNAVGSAAIYRSIGDVIPSVTFFNSATPRTLSARTPHNFNGNTVSNGSCMAAVNMNQAENRMDNQMTQRIFQNDTGFFEPRTKARLELMSSIDPTPNPNWPMLRVGRCTATGEPLFYYDVYRNYSTGYLHFDGNQTGFKRYVFDATVATPSVIINGGAALATSDQTGTGNIVLATSPTIASPTLTAPVLGVATATSIAIGGGTALSTSNQTGTGNIVLANTPTLTTPNIGAATGTSLTASGLIKSTGTAGVGYATGAGGTQTQSTSKSTTVVLNKICGSITMNNANLVAATIVSFTLTNSTIAATDVLILNHISGGTVGAYTLNAQAGAGSATINVRNATSGDLAEAIVIQFVVIKGVTS